MEESLREKQSRFVRMIAKLILFATEAGYELTFGDAYRDPRVFGMPGEEQGYGKPWSNHKHRLAVDFNLFSHGKWLTSTKDFSPLGAYWEMLGGSWGGRFNDPNHFSLEHLGRK